MSKKFKSAIVEMSVPNMATELPQRMENMNGGEAAYRGMTRGNEVLILSVRQLGTMPNGLIRYKHSFTHIKDGIKTTKRDIHISPF